MFFLQLQFLWFVFVNLKLKKRYLRARHFWKGSEMENERERQYMGWTEGEGEVEREEYRYENDIF